jgi:hypothetical protein
MTTMTDAEKIEIEQARDESFRAISACVQRLEAARVFLTLEQRYALAERARDLADALDQGRVLRVARASKYTQVKRLVPAERKDGETLYRLVDG